MHTKILHEGFSILRNIFEISILSSVLDRYLAEYSAANLKIAERGSLHDEADVLHFAPRNAHRIRCVFEGQPFPLADCAELEAELVTCGGIGATDPDPQFASL